MIYKARLIADWRLQISDSVLKNPDSIIKGKVMNYGHNLRAHLKLSLFLDAASKAVIAELRGTKHEAIWK